MITDTRNRGGAAVLGRASSTPREAGTASGTATQADSTELMRALAEVKGQAQFLLYLADQLEDSLKQLSAESDPGHGAFLCKILGMYASQLETKHLALGDRIAEACQEIYVSVRQHDLF